MNNENGVLFSGFNTLFSPDPQHQDQRALFLAAFSETFGQFCKEQMQKRSVNFIAEKLFEQFFIHHDHDLEEHFGVMVRLIRADVSLQTFFSKLFHIFLSKSLSEISKSRNDFWPSVSTFSRQVETFILMLDKYSGSDKELCNGDSSIDQEAIMRSFSRILDTGEKIVLLNSYQGVPIRFTATIIKTMPDTILVKANSVQLTAALLQQDVFILQNEIIEHDLHASAKLYQQKQFNLLQLSNFKALDRRVVVRHAVRVYPKINTLLALSFMDGKPLGEGTLMDISLGGIAILVNEPLSIKEGQNIQMHFNASLLGISQTVNGTLIFISMYNKGYRYHFKLLANTQQEKVIGAYISQREKEIIKSLREYLI